MERQHFIRFLGACIIGALIGVILAVTASASHAPASLTIVKFTAKSVTISWPAVPDVTGYGLFVDGVRVSTAGPAATQAKFGLPTWKRYVLGVSALKTGGDMSTITVDPRWVTVSTSIPEEPPPPPPPPPTGDTANLWVDSDGGSCARNSTPGSYSNTTACDSFAAAYQAAVSGDTVGVTGNLGVQKFAGGYQSSQPPGTKILLFRGNLSTNKVRQIHFGSPNLTFDGINADADMTHTIGAVFENGGDSFVFRNGRIGGVADEKAALVTGAGIVFENVVFHDAVIRTNGVHMECVWAGVPEGMIVRNSRFENCAIMDIFFTYPDYWSPLPPPYGNVTLENNWFDYPRSFNGSTNGYSIYIGKNGVSLSNQTPMSGWRVRNNFFREDPNSNEDYGVNNDQPVGSNNIFCGNTGHPQMPSSWKVPC